MACESSSGMPWSRVGTRQTAAGLPVNGASVKASTWRRRQGHGMDAATWIRGGAREAVPRATGRGAHLVDRHLADVRRLVRVRVRRVAVRHGADLLCKPCRRVLPRPPLQGRGVLALAPRPAAGPCARCTAPAACRPPPAALRPPPCARRLPPHTMTSSEEIADGARARRATMAWPPLYTGTRALHTANGGGEAPKKTRRAVEGVGKGRQSMRELSWPTPLRVAAAPSASRGTRAASRRSNVDGGREAAPGRPPLLTGCLASLFLPSCGSPEDDPSYRETPVPSPYPPPSLAALDGPRHERQRAGGLHPAGVDPAGLGAAPPPRSAVDEEPASRPASRHALDNMPEVTGKGRRLLESAGWKEGTGLGRQEQGAARSVAGQTTKALPDRQAAWVAPLWSEHCRYHGTDHPRVSRGPPRSGPRGYVLGALGRVEEAAAHRVRAHTLSAWRGRCSGGAGV